MSEEQKRPRFLNSKEVAELLRCKMITIERKAKNGDFPKGVCMFFNRKWLFNEEELLKFLFQSS